MAVKLEDLLEGKSLADLTDEELEDKLLLLRKSRRDIMGTRAAKKKAPTKKCSQA